MPLKTLKVNYVPFSEVTIYTGNTARVIPTSDFAVTSTKVTKSSIFVLSPWCKLRRMLRDFTGKKHLPEMMGQINQLTPDAEQTIYDIPGKAWPLSISKEASEGINRDNLTFGTPHWREGLYKIIDLPLYDFLPLPVKLPLSGKPSLTGHKNTPATR